MGFWNWNGWEAVSAFGTAVAFSGLVIQEAVRMRTKRNEQASKVFIRPKNADPNRPVWEVEIVNAGDRPITNVSIWGAVVIGNEVEWTSNDVTIVMLPNETETTTVPHRPGFGVAPDRGGRVYAQFTDASGNRWHANQYGKIAKGAARDRLNRSSRRVPWWRANEP